MIWGFGLVRVLCKENVFIMLYNIIVFIAGCTPYLLTIGC